MSYLFRKNSVSEVGVGEKVIFLENVSDDAKVGNEGTVVGVGADTISIRLAPKTQYEQENHNLCPVVELPEGDLHFVNFEREESPEVAEEAAPEVETPAEDPAPEADAPADVDAPVDGEGDAPADTEGEGNGDAPADTLNNDAAPADVTNVDPGQA